MASGARRSTRIRRKSRSGKKRCVVAEDLLRFHLLSDPQISPDGRTVVFVKKHVEKRDEYVSNLWQVRVARAMPRQFTAGGKDSHPRWSPDGERLAFIGARQASRPQVFTMSSEGGEATALTSFPEGVIGTFKWSPDGNWLAVMFREKDPSWTEDAIEERKKNGASPPPRVVDDWWYRFDGDGYFNAQRFALHLVDSRSGEHRPIFHKDTLGHFSFDFSPNSKQIAIVANTHRRALVRPWEDDVYLLRLKGRKLVRLSRLPVGPKSRIAWSPDGEWLAYAGRVGKDGCYSTSNLELFICDPRGRNVRSLTGNEDYCLMAVTLCDTAEANFNSALRWAADSRRVYFRLGWHGEGHIASAAVRGGKVRFHTSGPLEHALGNLSADGKTMVMTVASPTSPPEIFVAPVVTGRHQKKQLSRFNRDLLSEVELVRPQAHWVSSTGGVKVQVWSMRPGTKRRVPAVLQVHGGPHAQFGTPLFHEMQLLVANGYAVFFPNPRGSKGYGQAHCEAIRGAWGGADWEDIQAVIRFMQNDPGVDRKRLAIMGGSYGGYMTNWAISHSDAFAAAITDRCVSNLVSMFGTRDCPDEPDHYWPGNSWDRPEDLWNQSPLKYFGRVRTPTLIIHSEGDLRCSIEQAEQVFTALKLRNVPTRFVRYPGSTSHGMSRTGPPDLRLDRLEQILIWLKKYL